jgi:aminoglycoside N3'-acetyltransferase
MTKLTKEDLVKDIRALGVKEGDLLHLKVSMKSIGDVEGGAKTLLDALLEVVGKEGTLIF